MTDQIPFVDLAAQYLTIKSEVESAIQTVLSNCDFILGGATARFEENFARFVGVENAIGVGNGLDALRIILQALNIGEGDDIIVPANTFIATALAVSSVGARPILVDCDPSTYNIDPGPIEAAITPRTKAIIPVHLTGQAADMDEINEIGNRRGLHVVEDAAQAHGARYKGRSCGALGVAAAFSCYPGKNLGAYGDAGIVTTNDSELAARVRRLRNYGQAAKYHHVERGQNSRLDTLQAAVLDVKLRRLEEWNLMRAANAERYRARLERIEALRLQHRSNTSMHIFHLFIVETERRDELQAHLASHGIQTGIHYPAPIHLQPAYSDLGYGPGSFPHTERLAATMLSLPMYPELSADQIDKICDSTEAFFGLAS